MVVRSWLSHEFTVNLPSSDSPTVSCVPSKQIPTHALMWASRSPCLCVFVWVMGLCECLSRYLWVFRRMWLSVWSVCECVSGVIYVLVRTWSPSEGWALWSVCVGFPGSLGMMTRVGYPVTVYSVVGCFMVVCVLLLCVCVLCVCVYLSVCLPVCVSVCLIVWVSVCLSLCLSDIIGVCVWKSWIQSYMTHMTHINQPNEILSPHIEKQKQFPFPNVCLHLFGKGLGVLTKVFQYWSNCPN